jgi:acetyl-CoA decarbonylase/synthase complex subunit delta
MPFLHFEGSYPHPQAIAMEVYDSVPARFPPALAELFGDLLEQPDAMAKQCVEQHGADLVNVRLEGTHPEKGDRSPEEASEIVGRVLQAVGVPVLVTGHSHFDKCNEVLRKVAEDHAGERLLLGWVETDNYRTVAAACLAYGHCVVAQSPIDFNIAKQLNILLGNMDFPADRIVMDPMTGALGYGNEYTYSVMERLRLAALAGDEMLQMPMIVGAGWECTRVKEAFAPAEEYPEWGACEERLVNWEVGTAASLLLAGGDILTVNHPRSVERLRAMVGDLMGAGVATPVAKEG